VTASLEPPAVARLASCSSAPRPSPLAYGPRNGGLISAFPLIVGPVLLQGALRQRPAGSVETAVATLLGLVALNGSAVA
jgi:hypothetical protein